MCIVFYLQAAGGVSSTDIEADELSFIAWQQPLEVASPCGVRDDGEVTSKPEPAPSRGDAGCAAVMAQAADLPLHYKQPQQEQHSNSSSSTSSTSTDDLLEEEHHRVLSSGFSFFGLIAV